MRAMKLRLLVIGGINALIAVALLAARGYSEIYLGYLAVSMAVVVVGLLLKKE